jgi:hypothetical protein
VSSVKAVFLSEEKEFLRKLFVTLELSILPIELCKNIGSRISSKTCDRLAKSYSGF